MALADLDELTRRATTGDGRGGRRPGAGRKKGSGKKPAPEVPLPEIRTVEQLLEDGPPPPIEGYDDDTGALAMRLLENPSEFYATGKARKEIALAAKAELEYKIKLGQYLPRDAVKSAVATAFQAVSQALRSIPDNIERKLGLQPDITEFVAIAIDETLGELANELEDLYVKAHEAATKE